MEFPKSFLGSGVLKRVVVVAVGALLGYSYYFFIGCSSGACPITSNPWRSTAYGAILGVILTFEKRSARREEGTSQKRES